MSTPKLQNSPTSQTLLLRQLANRMELYTMAVNGEFTTARHGIVTEQANALDVQIAQREQATEKLCNMLNAMI